ncbi:MAG: oligoendopeptidase F [Clostridia bacterium]|jgi:oligoendopeptidase F|nr:oligoendopeptidase F [Clostridia bacterium]
MQETKDSKYSWNLQDLFKNEEEFNKEKNEIKEILEKIKTYQGNLCNIADNLYNCYSLYEQALEKYERVYSYGMLKYHLDMSNQEGIKLFKEVEILGTDFSVATSFITPEITYADEVRIQDYLKNDKRLLPYSRDIKDILEKKKHVLSKEEENILANLSETISAPENTFDMLTNVEFKFGKLKDENGEEVELTDSNYTLYLKSQSQEVRKQAFNLMYKKYSEFVNTITEMYIANVKAKTTIAKLRKYNSSLEQAVDHDDASIKVYNSLIESIDENISSNYKFLELKKKMLNLSEMHMYDLYFNPCEQGKDEISFEEAKDEVLNALEILGKEYIDKLNEAFDNNWIDVFAKDNKRSGAYSMGVYGIHPFVLTNFVNSKRDVSTIAHELGHSMHSYYSNTNQNVIDSNYTIMVAEVASTVNEILLSDYQIKNEKDNKKKAELLYELLEMIRATFFRQAMFAEFEKLVHEKIESGEMLSSEDLNKIYYGLNKKYFGEAVSIDEEIKYEWARIPHFYSDFYVYKYATGVSAAIAIATKILNKEPGFVEKYIDMLKQGCSQKSIDLLKMVDVDLENKNTYKYTIKFYEERIEELKKIIN